MKSHTKSHDHTARRLGRSRLNTPFALLTVLTLASGALVTGGCVAVPALLVSSAAITAAAVVSEGERLVQYPDAGNTAFVRNESNEESVCTQTCQPQEAPPADDPTDAS
jgi:hypothetical protein